ncbi:hypothetical protein ACFLWL_03320 [Chloroflexota bacterium]
MLSDLSTNEVGVDSLAERALKDEERLSGLLEGILSKKEAIRYNSFKALLLISEEHPEVLYPRWDFFAGLINSANTYLKYIAIYIIANLTRVDTESKFEKIFNQYYNLLDDRSIIPAGHVAGNSGKIAKAKPELQVEITSRLLGIDKTRHKPERKDLIKSYAIESFSEYFEEADDKNEIIEFVEKQLISKSPKTRKKAKEFLEKWAKS